jgi:hypothetical protein
MPAAQFSDAGRQRALDGGIAVEHRLEARLDYDRDPQIGPGLMENRERGRSEHAIAQGPQPDDGYARPRREALKHGSGFQRADLLLDLRFVDQHYRYFVAYGVNPFAFHALEPAFIGLHLNRGFTQRANENIQQVFADGHGSDQFIRRRRALLIAIYDIVIGSLMLNQVALVSQTAKIQPNELAQVSAAIQKQVTRDVSPVWSIEATVDNFPTLEDVPLGYWSVVIMDQIPYDAAGIHLNKENGQPFALVAYSPEWSLTASHETIEMLVDPSGNRTVAANSPDPKQGRVLILVEACDPSEASQFGYSVNGILLSDFYTPRFFDPVASSGVQYSFTGALKEPLQVLDGGYISWWEPSTTHVFQLFVRGQVRDIVDLGPLPPGFGSLRSFTDSFTNKYRAKLAKTLPLGVKLGAAFVGKNVPETSVDTSTKANAASLRGQIAAVLASYGKP